MVNEHSSFSGVFPSVTEAQDVRRDTSPANRPNLDLSVQAILERARAAEQRTLAASCAHAAVEARQKRAEEAWLRVALFRGDRIPQGIPVPALSHHYAELIVALGRVLQADGWQARVDAVSPGSEAKMYALAQLRRAMAGDLVSVEEMVKEAIATLFNLGLQADSWLRDGLRYEVLEIEHPPEPPVGWEGCYWEPVESIRDFVRWLDGMLLRQAHFGETRGQERSSGAMARNAFRLVTRLHLSGMPLEVPGPYTLHEEFGVLRNLRRVCLPLIGKPGSSKGHHPVPGRAGSSQAKKQPGQRGAELLVTQSLAGKPDPSIVEVVQATGLTERRIRRTHAWKVHEESRLEAFLQAHPRANTGDVQEAFGWSPAKSVGKRAWKMHVAARQAAKSAGRIKERPFSKRIEQCLSDRTAADPTARLESRDQLFRTLVEDAEPIIKARLNRLTGADQERLLEYVLERFADIEGRHPGNPGAIRTILVEVAKTWLDEQEQECRRARRSSSLG